MKRLILLSLIINLLGFSGKASSGGPDRFGYTWKDSNEPGGPVYAWWDITTTGTLVSGLKDDNVVGPLPMLQGFQYFWYQPTSFWIGSNGYIGFDGGVLASPFSFNLNWNRGVKNIVAPMICDLDFTMPGNPGRCYYQIKGDSLCVSWVNVPLWDSPLPVGSNSFQVIFNRANHSITFNYNQISGNAIGGRFTTFSSKGGLHGLSIFNGQTPPTNYSIRIEYPTNSNFSIYDVSVKDLLNRGTKAEIYQVGSAPRRFKTRISNDGTQIAQNLVVNGEVSRRGGTPTSLGSVSIPNLLPGKDTTIEFPQSWTSNQIGRYTLSANIQGANADSIPLDNTLAGRIIMVDSSHGRVQLSYADGIPTTSAQPAPLIRPASFGVYLKPTFYPARIRSARIFHRQLPTFNFAIKLYKDDGPGGTPGTLLDSTLVSPNQVIASAYNAHPLSNKNLTLASGGVFMEVEFFSGTVSLSCDTAYPPSNRQYSIEEGHWGEFRFGSWAELAMGLDLEGMPANDLSLQQITAPTPGWMPANNSPISIWVKNRGQVAVNQFNAAYQAGGRNPVAASYSGTSIQPGDSVLFNFPQPFQTIGLQPDDEFCLWVNLPSDSISYNDSLCFYLQIGVGSSNLVTQKLKLYPNPIFSNQTLTIQLPEHLSSGSWQLELLDLAGRRHSLQSVTVSGQPTGQTISWKIPEVKAGVYQIVLSNNATVYRETLVISGQ